jgi:hypothetical protein
MRIRQVKTSAAAEAAAMAIVGNPQNFEMLPRVLHKGLSRLLSRT